MIVAAFTGADLRPLFEAFRAKRLPFADPQTVYQYRLNLLQRFPEFLGREPTTDDLRDELITDCMAWLVRTKGLSPTSANKMRDNFNCFWSYLARQRIVEKFPEIAEMPEPEKIPVAWTREQLHTLWDAMVRQPGEWGGVPVKLWWVSMHSAGLWDCASRIGALMQVRWAQVDLRDRWLTLRPETMKGKRRGRVCRLHPESVELLRSIELPQREFVWPFPYARQTYIYTLYRAMLEGAGLPADRDHMFHCMRKSAASFCEAAGGDAQRVLGHASRSMTEVYLDPRITGGIDTNGLLFRPGDPPAA